MAKRQLIDRSNLGENRSISYYINETSVGKNGQNSKTSDIQLVQFFLKQFFDFFPKEFKNLPKTTKNKGKFSIDGKVGPQTIRGLEVFQKSLLHHVQLKPLGLCKVPINFDSNGFFHSETILALNEVALNINAEQKKFNYYELQNHPDLIAHAPELRFELTIDTYV